MRHAIAATCAVTVFAGAPAFAPASAVNQAIQKAVPGPTRSARFTAQDGARHPAEELAFFGVNPSATVVEIWPGNARGRCPA